MLLKIAGAVLVVSACSALGFGYGRSLNQHLEELRFLRELYQMIWGEIEYTKEPFPEVMLEISSRIKEPYASLFVQAHRAFEEQGSLRFPEWFRDYVSRTLEAYRKEKHLSVEEWEMFLSLGSQTGYLDLSWSAWRGFSYNLASVKKTRKKKEGKEVRMSVSLIFKIAAVGILVSILSQVLKHSGREEQAFLTSLAGLILVLIWIVPYIYDLFETMRRLFAL